jgi:hypothetical protein
MKIKLMIMKKIKYTKVDIIAKINIKNLYKKEYREEKIKIKKFSKMINLIKLILISNQGFLIMKIMLNLTLQQKI